MSTLDFRPHADAIEAAIKAALPASVNVYDYSTVPGSNGNAGTLPTSYVVVAVERRFNPNLRASAQAGSTGWRLSARCFSTTVNNAGLLLAAVADALDENRLTVAGNPTTPIQHESTTTPEWDSGKYTAYSLWTYAH